MNGADSLAELEFVSPVRCCSRRTLGGRQSEESAGGFTSRIASVTG
jgi:hypothetical protein